MCILFVHVFRRLVTLLVMLVWWKIWANFGVT